MQLRGLPFWKQAPATRILFAWVAGILAHYHLHPVAVVPVTVIFTALAVFLLFRNLPAHFRFHYAFIPGICILLAVSAAGALVTRANDISCHSSQLAVLSNSKYCLVRMDEPLAERARSFRATATVLAAGTPGKFDRTAGKLLVYFPKTNRDSLPAPGDLMQIVQPLRPIVNSGNPGEFDFKRYCLFKGITHQVYLPEQSYKRLYPSSSNPARELVFRCREKIIQILQQAIPAGRERGLAEALLIGYKDDLDRDLVQQYANTGVVHIVAISGLHLGLVYGMLLLVCRPLRRYRFVSPLIILSGLWLFSLMAGAQPSVLRSALMFTCIVLGESMFRRSPIINSLAFSAFLLLCINPFWLWDVGFQLSYSAVLSIVLFMKAIYNKISFNNPLLDYCWQMMSVTLAAQILTFPICAYQFHQFPVYFLVTNLVALPLSSLILVSEILLCALSFSGILASALGHVVQFLVHLMNGCIERVADLPFPVWGNWQLSAIQCMLLFLVVVLAAQAVIFQQRKLLIPLLGCLFAFGLLRSISFVKVYNQRRLIVYNLPGVTQIDVIAGRNFFSVTKLQTDPEPYQAVLTRSLFRASFPAGAAKGISILLYSKQRGIAITDDLHFSALNESCRPHIVILTALNLRNIPALPRGSPIQLVVFTSGCNTRLKAVWKKNCRQLGIACHDVITDGAFVMNNW